MDEELRKNLGQSLNYTLATACGKEKPTKYEVRKIEKWLDGLAKELED